MRVLTFNWYVGSINYLIYYYIWYIVAYIWYIIISILYMFIFFYLSLNWFLCGFAIKFLCPFYSSSWPRLHWLRLLLETSKSKVFKVVSETCTVKKYVKQVQVVRRDTLANVVADFFQGLHFTFSSNSKWIFHMGDDTLINQARTVNFL